MPVTPAHPSAVLLLRRTGLPMAALVIGSMVPDLPMFVGGLGGYGVPHSLGGVLTVDLVASLVLLLAWDRVLRDALVDLAPEVVRARLAARRRLSLRHWLLAPAAIVLGSVTHVVWDSFTHPGRWGVEHLSWLAVDLGPLPGYQWAQYLSGVLGLAVVLGAVVAELRSRPVGAPLRRRVLPAPVLPVAVGVAAAWALTAGLARVGDGLHAVAFHGVVQAIVATAAAVLVSSAAWLLASRRPAPPG